MIWQCGAVAQCSIRYGSHVSTRGLGSRATAWRLSSAGKIVRLSFFRSCPVRPQGFAGLQVAHYAEKLLSLSQMDFTPPPAAAMLRHRHEHPSAPDTADRALLRCSPPTRTGVSPAKRARRHFTGQIPAASSNLPGKGALLGNKEAPSRVYDFRNPDTPHPIDLDDHRCHKSTSHGKSRTAFAHVERGRRTSGHTHHTLDPLDSPRLRRIHSFCSLGLFVNLMLIDPVPWPI